MNVHGTDTHKMFVVVQMEDAEFYLRMQKWTGGAAMLAFFFSAELSLFFYLLTVGVERLHLDAAMSKRVSEPFVLKDLDCPICFESGGMWVNLSCNHAFHKECTDMWRTFSVSEGVSCPMCRSVSYL